MSIKTQNQNFSECNCLNIMEQEVFKQELPLCLPAPFQGFNLWLDMADVENNDGPQMDYKKCHVRSCRKGRKDGVSLHGIPKKDEKAAQRYIHFLKLANQHEKWNLRQTMFVCSLHFPDYNFNCTVKGNASLLEGSFPVFAGNKDFTAEILKIVPDNEGGPQNSKLKIMESCVVCGDTSRDKNSGTVGNIDQSRAARFFVRLLLDAGSEYDEFLSHNKLLEWWSTCEDCQSLIEDSLEIYNQIVDLAETLRRKQKDLVTKLKKWEGRNKDFLSPRATSKTNVFARELRQALASRDWNWNAPPLTVIQKLSGFEDNFVKDEVASDQEEELELENVTPVLCLPYIIQNPSENETSARERLEDSFTSNPVKKSESERQTVSDYDETFLSDQGEDWGNLDCVNSELRCSDNDKRDPDRSPNSPPPISNEEKRGRKARVLPDLQLNLLTGAYHCPSCSFASLNKTSLRVHYRRIHLKEQIGSKEKTADGSEQQMEGDLSKESKSMSLDNKYGIQGDDSSAKTSESFCDFDKITNSKKKSKPKRIRYENKERDRNCVLPDLKINPSTKRFPCPNCDFEAMNKTSVRTHYRRFHLKEFVGSKKVNVATKYKECESGRPGATQSIVRAENELNSNIYLRGDNNSSNLEPCGYASFEEFQKTHEGTEMSEVVLANDAFSHINTDADNDVCYQESYSSSPSTKRRRTQQAVKKLKKKYAEPRRKLGVLPDLEVNPFTNMFHCPSCFVTSAWKSNLRMHYRRTHLIDASEIIKREGSEDLEATHTDIDAKSIAESDPLEDSKWQSSHDQDPNSPKRVIKPRSAKTKKDYSEIGENAQSEGRRARRKKILPKLRPNPSTGKYHCPLCDLALIHSESVRIHYRRIHLKEKIIARDRRENAERRKKIKEQKLKEKELQEKILQEQKLAREKERLDESKVAGFRLGRVYPNLVLPDLKKDPETNRYPCPSCEYTSSENRGVRLHYKKYHLNEIKTYSCTWPECGRTFTNHANFNGHMDKHKGTPRFKCSQCSLAFYTKNPLVRHRQRDHEGGRESRHFVCDQCGKSFSNRDYLQTHKSQVHTRERTKEPVVCEICGVTVKGLSQHKKKVHGKIGRSSAVGGDEAQDKDPNPDVICSICGKEMKQISLAIHMRNIHQDMSYETKWTCSVCQSAFATQNTLDVHLYSKHQIGAPTKQKFFAECTFVCEVKGCPKRFKYESQLNVHKEEIHGPDGNKPAPYECRFCGRRFFVKLKHKQHEEVHENSESNRKFNCETCGKGFVTERHLRYHLQYTHKIKFENRRGKRST